MIRITDPNRKSVDQWEDLTAGSPQTDAMRRDPTDERDELRSRLHTAGTHLAEHEGHGAAQTAQKVSRFQPRKVSPYQASPTHSRIQTRTRANRNEPGAGGGLLL